jgi:hypothetical protein
MIVKIIRDHGIRDKNKKSRGRRGLTLTRIILHHNNIFREHVQKGKNGKNKIITG